MLTAIQNCPRDLDDKLKLFFIAPDKCEIKAFLNSLFSPPGQRANLFKLDMFFRDNPQALLRHTSLILELLDSGELDSRTLFSQGLPQTWVRLSEGLSNSIFPTVGLVDHYNRFQFDDINWECVLKLFFRTQSKETIQSFLKKLGFQDLPGCNIRVVQENLLPECGRWRLMLLSLCPCF